MYIILLNGHLMYTIYIIRRRPYNNVIITK